MSDPQRLVFGPFEFDLRDERLWCAADRIHLNPKAFAVLHCLLTQAGQLVTKDELFATVWPDTAVSEAVLATSIRELRRALDDRAHTPQYIETVYGRGYRFIAPVRMAESAMMRPASALPSQLSSPFARSLSGSVVVGRESELAQLQQWFEAALQGERQVGFITGEAGIGKTALVDAFADQMTATSDLWVGHGQCVEQYGAGEPYLPLLEAFGRLCRGADGAHLLELLRQHAPSWLRQMPSLLTSSEREMLQRQDSGMTRERMLRELTEAIEVLTAEQPLVLVLEDLHWSDVSTLEWLSYVARRREPARVLILGTYRPVDVIVHTHPLRPVITELRQHGQCVERVLDYLSEVAVTAYLSQRFGPSSLPDRLAWVLHQRTNGNPFFLVTMVDEMIRQEVLVHQGAGWAFFGTLASVAVGVPESVRDLIESQLEQLSVEHQEMLEAASVAGTEFDAAAVATALDGEIEEVETWCEALARREQFLRAIGVAEWPDRTVAARYRFIHDLYHDVVYERLAASRRIRWHQQIGMRLEAGYGDQAKSIAVELAMHFVRGREPQRAVQYLRYAAEQALQRSAHHESITHCTAALELLAPVPQMPERAHLELVLLTLLGSAYIALKGQAAPEVEHVYTRALTLCHEVGDTTQHFTVLRGLQSHYTMRGALETAQEFGEQLLQQAHLLPEPTFSMVASQFQGTTLFYRGEFAQARWYLERVRETYASESHRTLSSYRHQMDLEVRHLNWISWVLWMEGYPDQALDRSREARALAEELSHPFSLTTAYNWATFLHQFRREEAAALEQAETVIRLAQDQQFVQWLAMGRINCSAIRAKRDYGDQALVQLHQSLDAYQTLGAELARPYFLALLVDVYAQRLQPAEALHVLTDALAVVTQTQERWWEAELHRFKGELLLTKGVPETDQVEACFHQALNVARRQQAKSLELRTVMSLGRLWQQQGKPDEARELLAPVYEWFTEGFDTADLQDAKVLLNELSRAKSPPTG